MKKIAVLVALLLALTLTACNNTNENTTVTENGGDTVASDVVTDDTAEGTTAPEAEDTTAPEAEDTTAPTVEDTEKTGETETEGSEPEVTEPETEGTTMPETTEPEVTTTPEVPVEDEKNQATTEPDTDNSSVIPETSNATPEHKHAYKDTVVAPTCENGGYTVHTCDCGHSYSDKETKATGHSYTEKVVAPTTSAQGYTLHTCSKCGTSYKDSYVDKLPTQTTTPSNPGNTGDTGYEEGGHVGETQTSGGITVTGSNGIAGQFTDVSSETREFYTPGMDRDQAESAINGYVGYVYSRRFFDDGISMNYADPGKFAKIVENNGKLGVNVFQWRKSYDSDFATNSSLNMVMEAFYFFTKDKNVAHALWNVVDYMSINGAAATTVPVVEGFGFTCSNETSNSIDLTKNDIHIRWEWGGGNTFYFG